MAKVPRHPKTGKENSRPVARAAVGHKKSNERNSLLLLLGGNLLHRFFNGGFLGCDFLYGLFGFGHGMWMFWFWYDARRGSSGAWRTMRRAATASVTL
jgi:hypothetical protein